MPKPKHHKPASNEYWTTAHEIDFLQRLGSHREPNPLRCSRTVLLIRYRQACVRRKQWGMVDRDIIKTYLSMELADGK
jgi:hypothetical protein